MPIDPAIALQIQPVQVPNLLQQRATLQSLQAGQQESQQRQQALQEGQLKLNQLNQQQSDDQAVRDAFSHNTVKAADGSVSLDQAGALGDLYKTAPLQALSYQNAFTTQKLALQKSGLETQKAQLENTAKQNDLFASVLTGVTDQASYDKAKQYAAQLGINPATIPQQYDPQFIQTERMKSLSTKDQLDFQSKAIDQQLKQHEADEKVRQDGINNTFKAQEVGETARHNRASEGMQGAELGLKRQELGLRAQEVGIAAGQKLTAEESTQRAQFEHISEPFRIQTQAYNEALSAAQGKPTASSDRALVAAAQAIQNPRGNARPGQVQQGLQATGFSNFIGAAVNRVSNGSLLSDTQRAQIVSTLTDQYKAAEQQHMQNVNSSRNIAARANLNPDNVTPEYKSVFSPNNSAATGKVRAVDPQGVPYEAPAGTPLPAGWRAQ